MKTFELIPTNGRKSFNRKCIVIEENNISLLKSYDTIVASYDHLKNEMKIKDFYSTTTLRHINAFLNFYGFDTVTKKELEKIYLNK